MALRKSMKAFARSTSAKSQGETRSRIAKRAYELFQKRGCAHGCDFDDWLQAEREVTAEYRAKK